MNTRYWARAAVLYLTAALACFSQMTPEQKSADFTQLAANFAKNYGPMQWKRDALNFDLLKIQPWLDRVAQTTTDLDFYELCVQYIASLDDAHSGFYLPANFTAQLPFSADLYDGKAMVDELSPILEGSNLNIRIGDEVLSIDGTRAGDLITSLMPYATAANPVSTRRYAAALLTVRPQQIMPHAVDVGDTAMVTLRHQNGDVETLQVPWMKSGEGITVVGPVISPDSANVSKPHSASQDAGPLAKLRHMALPSLKFVANFGAGPPVFYFPPDFVRRRDGISSFFYSGTYKAAGLRIGYIRIPNFEASDQGVFFQQEIDYMQQNTDGLIIDIMRNPGGDACFAQELMSRITPQQFHMVGLEIRATRNWLLAFQLTLSDAVGGGAPDSVVQQYQQILNAIQAAFLAPSGITAPLPVCGPSLDVAPATDDKGTVIAYTKPVMLLTDEFSASAADLFAAMFQDNQRGIIFGTRTMGAGGNVEQFDGVTTYSDGSATITESLMTRWHAVDTPEFGVTPYVENVGVRPDIIQDYMTVDNLENGGQTFIAQFTQSMVDHIRKQTTAGAARRPGAGIK